MNTLTHSPLAYAGSKHRALRWLLPLFSRDINGFVDLFCGAANVVANMADCGPRYANDANPAMIDIWRTLQHYDPAGLEREVDRLIARWGLDSHDPATFNRFRDHYNTCGGSPVELFVLAVHSFNQQIRFNSAGAYNSSSGKAHHWFTPTVRENLRAFIPRIRDVEFTCSDFTVFDFTRLNADGFVYADPPYTLGTAVYNDRPHGTTPWTVDDDRRLFTLLDELGAHGIRFALSNVMEHKGRINEPLQEWVESRGLLVYGINIDYASCNYQNRNRQHATQEVLVTNYRPDGFSQDTLF